MLVQMKIVGLFDDTLLILNLIAHGTIAFSVYGVDIYGYYLWIYCQ